jgi:hypothetical protein
MENFKKKSINFEHLPKSDLGVKVASLIPLISENEFYNELKKLLRIDEYFEDFIEIPGANTLVNTIQAINKKFKKTDLISDFKNISLYSDNNFTINFDNISNNSYLENLGLENLSTTPIYSASRDFFSELFQMDKYASKLIAKGYRDIINKNLELLKQITSNKRKYRLLHEITENKFYLRAIISTGNYYNYDNNLAIVMGLLTLHNEMKNTDVIYKLKTCEYNESAIRMFFESNEVRELDNIGYVRNIVEISNDEIKREALRFSGVCTIEFEDKNSNKNEIFIKPKDIKSKILSIKHNQLPNTAIKELAKIKNAKKVHGELIDDILKIKNIKNPEQIKFIFKQKVEKARREELQKHKKNILSLLNKKVDNIIELLEVFSKIDLVAVGDIEVKEYLRYIMYESLIEKK